MNQYENDKRVAIVILNWNGRELMRRFLPSVVAHCPAWADVIVADNGSTDDSIAMLEREFPQVGLLCLDRNYGFAEGYNRAIARLPHPYCVLLNSDVEVTAGWLEPLIQILDKDQTIAAAQPKIHSWHQRDHFEYAGAAGGFIDYYGYPYCRGRVLDRVEKDEGQYDQPADLFWATGACLVVRTAVYRDVGGLDTRFFAHQEEIDLCWRLRTRGWRIVCRPESVVYHLGGATLSAENPHKTFLNMRNNLLMLYKNLPEKELAGVMRTRYWLDHLAALHAFLSRRPREGWAILDARKEYKRLRPEFAAQRKENLERATGKPIPERSHRCLILDFYLLGKKTFTKLGATNSPS